MRLLEVENLRTTFRTEDGPVTAVNGLSFGLDAGEAKTRVGELIGLTRDGGTAAEPLARWLNACDGSARCNSACPEEINVRQWVTIAKLKALEAGRPRVMQRSQLSKSV